MAYRKIHWIKLEKRLLNDHRFYTMSQDSQLVYLKLLMLAAETANKVPKSHAILRAALRATQEETEIGKSIKEIKEHFPKFKEHKNFYYFLGWSTRHNWVDTSKSPSNSSATNKLAVDKTRIRIEYIKLKGWTGQTFSKDFYGRTGKAINKLFVLTNQDSEIIDCLRWASKKWPDMWTLETCIKKWPDFKASKAKQSKTDGWVL